jgi:hypothetical protein
MTTGEEDEDSPEELVARVTAPQHARTPAWRRAPDFRALAGRRAAFRAWRHSRPFSGGLLLVIAGIELLALPLSGVLFKGALKLVIYIAIGGVFGVLIGILLIAAGIMLWINPAHRVFYAIAGIVLGLASFPASNLGGLFIAMLLAIIGGSLAFAWEPVGATENADDAGREPAEPAGPRVRRLRVRRLRVRGLTRGHRVFSVAAMPALLVAGMLGTSAHASTPQSGGLCILGIICLSGPSSSPSPQPSPSPSPSTGTPSSPKPTPSPSCPPVSPSPSPKPTPTPTPTPGPSCSSTPAPKGGGSPTKGGGSPTKSSASASPSPGATSGSPSSGTGGESGKKPAKKAAAARQVADPGLTAPCATSVLDAGSATLTSFAFKGIVHMPVGCGGTQAMMEFTASSATLDGGVTVTVTQGGQNTVTTSPTLGFSSGMTLYATKLCGKLAGIPLCFTPTTVSAVLLSIANLLTSVLPITLTNVVTDQPLALAGGLQTGPLSIGF